jgi:pimeloyl-ACP methyl ester carboxylesterase
MKFLLGGLVLLAACQFPAADTRNQVAEIRPASVVAPDLSNAWTTLPPTPALPLGGKQGSVQTGGAQIFYARYGQGSPVILLHGGMGNANYWGHQILVLAAKHDVIAIDFRGHGRSTMSVAPMSYDLLASDVLAVMDSLGLRRAAIVGWSDGAIVGLSLALTHPDRLDRLFAFGANTDLSGLIPNGPHSDVFARYSARTAAEYRSLSPQPNQYRTLVQRMTHMWATEPNFSAAQMATIRIPVAIADGEWDEVIKAQHTRDIAAAIPSSTLIVESGVSHFAMLQNPAQFNADLLKFLGER